MEEILRVYDNKDRLNMIKYMVSTVKQCNTCGLPASKIVKETNKATSTISIFAKTQIFNEESEKKKELKQMLIAELISDIFRNINDTDCRLMGLDKNSRPEDMIIKIFHVPPIHIRPSAKVDFAASSTMEDDITHKIVDIVRGIIGLKKIEKQYQIIQ